MTLENAILVDRFAFWKVAVLEMLLGALAILPLTSGFGDGLTFGAFFYSPAVFPILVIACLALGFLFIIILPVLVWALLGRPAIEITSSMLTMYSLPTKQIAVSEIMEMGEPVLGTSRVKLKGAKQISVPLFFYRNGDRVRRRLKALADNSQHLTDI